jgi:hypothetical protein
MAAHLENLGFEPSIIPKERKTVYTENMRERWQKELKAILVEEALDYGLASCETSYIATRKEAGKIVEATVPVANALPAGWSEDFVSHAYTISPSSAGPVSFDMACYSCMAKPSDKMQRVKDQSKQVILFEGIPTFIRDRATLFDSSKESGVVPNECFIDNIRVELTGVKPEDISDTLMLEIFIDDMTMPRAKMKLVDLIRGGGNRPLNLIKNMRNDLRVVLTGPREAWVENLSAIKIEMGANIIG